MIEQGLIEEVKNILEKYNNLKKQKTFIPKIIYKNLYILKVNPIER